MPESGSAVAVERFETECREIFDSFCGTILPRQCAGRNCVSGISTFETAGSGPVVVGPSPFFNAQGRHLAALMVRHALPAIFQTREFRGRHPHCRRVGSSRTWAAILLRGARTTTGPARLHVEGDV